MAKMTDDFRSFYLPYCLQKQPDGRYAVLNRRYKPLGFITGEHIDYAAYPSLAKMRMTAKLAAGLSWKGDTDVETVYLYNDGTNPVLSAKNMAAYMERLARLMKFKVSNN